MNPRRDGPLEPWEVFRQEKDGDPMRHGGSVMAPDGELATHYARELFGRMAFNALISNTDDHPRNHAAIAPGPGWRLSPAYDLTPTPAFAAARARFPAWASSRAGEKCSQKLVTQKAQSAPAKACSRVASSSRSAASRSRTRTFPITTSSATIVRS